MTARPAPRLLLVIALPLSLLGAAACSSSPVATSTEATSPAKAPATTAKAQTATTKGRAAGTTTTAADDDGATDTTAAGDDDTTGTTEAGETAAACDWITEEDATKAFGAPATAGTQSSTECWWSTANDLKTINVIHRTEDLDEWRRGYQNSSWEKIDLGDEAYAGKVLDSIVFRKGDDIYEINVVYSTKGDPDQVVKDLAGTVASRV